MSGEPYKYFEGTLTGDPELRFSKNGKSYAYFSVATNPRRRDPATGDWVNSDPIFTSCVLWGQQAVHLVESVGKGVGLVIGGREESRSYVDSDGKTQTRYQVNVDHIGVSVRYNVVAVKKSSKRQQASSGGDQWTMPTGMADDTDEIPPF